MGYFDALRAEMVPHGIKVELNRNRIQIVKLKQAIFTIFSTVAVTFSLAAHVIASTDSPAEKIRPFVTA